MTNYLGNKFLVGLCYMAPPADAVTLIRVLSGWGLGLDLVSLVPCLGNALGVVGVLKSFL